MNIDYSQFYRGTTNIPSYGNGTYKKDTLVKYEFNTTDEHGNKIMDKMSREETLQLLIVFVQNCCSFWTTEYC